MKLRYYLRGLGIGMLVAALVLTISGSTRAKMSDEAVKRRAAELGMVEKDKSVLSDISGGAGDGENTAVSGQEPLPEVETVKEPDVSEGMPEETLSGQAGEAAAAENRNGETDDAAVSENTAGQAGDETASDTQNPTQETEQKVEEIKNKAEEIAGNAPTGRKFTLEVHKGDSSVAVARRAQEIGLITSAADFDVFLCQNGYDKRISVGTYTIPENSSNQYIADVITRSR